MRMAEGGAVSFAEGNTAEPSLERWRSCPHQGTWCSVRVRECCACSPRRELTGQEPVLLEDFKDNTLA